MKKNLITIFLGVITLILMGVVAYFSIELYRGVEKQQRESIAFRLTLSVGDSVQLSQNVYGRVESMNGDSIKIRVNTKRDFIYKP